jgi:hypothetical protein
LGNGVWGPSPTWRHPNPIGTTLARWICYLLPRSRNGLRLSYANQRGYCLVMDQDRAPTLCQLGSRSNSYITSTDLLHPQSNPSNPSTIFLNPWADSFMTKPAESTGYNIIILLIESKHSFHGSKFPAETKLVT